MMKYSLSGEHLTEQFEGCKLAAYQDQGGRWTCGFGHTSGVTAETTCTPQQAEEWLMQDIQTAASNVNRLVTIPLTQSEFDSLCDFCYNVGGGNFASSTMLKLLNAGDTAGAADQFERWDKVGGQVVAGLLRRRIAEKQEFESL